MRKFLGFGLFLLAAILSGLSAWETPSVLAALNTVHNALLAILYVTRLPAQRSDNFGLILGLTAALLPAFAGTSLVAPHPFGQRQASRVNCWCSGRWSPWENALELPRQIAAWYKTARTTSFVTRCIWEN